MSLSNADRQALDAQYRQWNYERIHLGLDAPEWDRFIAWRTAVALEEQAAALWSEDESEESRKPWEE